MDKKFEDRMSELDTKADRTPEEQDVLDALHALDEKAEALADAKANAAGDTEQVTAAQTAVDEATKAVDEAEAALKAA